MKVCDGELYRAAVTGKPMRPRKGRTSLVPHPPSNRARKERQGTRAPQSPQDQHRLEQEPDTARDVARETEGVGVLNKLRDIAGKNGDEE